MRETWRFTARLAYVATILLQTYSAQICSSQVTVASNTKGDSEGKGLRETIIQ